MKMGKASIAGFKIQNKGSLILSSLLVAQTVKSLLAVRETLVWFLGQEDPWRRERLPTPVFLDFSCGSAGKESACSAGDLGSIPGLGRSPGEGKGYPLQYSGLENSIDCIVHWVTRARHGWATFTFTLLFPASPVAGMPRSQGRGPGRSHMLQLSSHAATERILCATTKTQNSLPFKKLINCQSCPTLCDPMDTRLLHPWEFLGKNTGVGCHFLLQ